MLGRRPRSARLLRAVGAKQGDPSGDAIRAVLGDRDRWLACAAPVHLVPGFGAVDRVAQRTGRAVPDGADDLVHPAPARRHERLGAGVEDGGQPVGAKPGVLADAAVVVDHDLLAVVDVAPVGYPLRVLSVGKAGPGAAAVAERLDRRVATPAQRPPRGGPVFGPA